MGEGSPVACLDQGENNLGTRMKVSASTCVEPSRVSVGSHRSNYSGVKQFNAPYRADFE